MLRHDVINDVTQGQDVLVLVLTLGPLSFSGGDRGKPLFFSGGSSWLEPPVLPSDWLASLGVGVVADGSRPLRNRR